MFSEHPIDRRLLDGFLADCGAASETKRIYRHEIELFGRYLEARLVPFEAATRDDMILFSRWMQTLYSPGTVNHTLSSLRRFYEWLDAEQGIGNIAKRIPFVPASSMAKRKGLTASQSNAVLQASESAGKADVRARDSAIVHLSLLAAMSPREITSANVGDVLHSPGSSVVRVPEAKGRPSSVVLLTNKVALALEKHLSFRSGAVEGDPLFTSLSNRSAGKRLASRSLREIVQRIFERAGVPGTAGDYSMTKTAILMAMEGGASPREVRELSRARSMYSERRYELAYMERVGTPQEKAQKVLEKSSSEKFAVVVTAGEVRRMLGNVSDGESVTVSLSNEGILEVTSASSDAGIF